MTFHYGLLTYRARPEYNVGDYIQSLAAARFLPRVDHYINREQLAQYNHEPVKLIMNGWFMHAPQNWPPSAKIEPLLVSFHLNSQVKDQLLNAKGAEWFRKHGPVGCRDLYTLNAMQQAGLESYLSGCLTTTLQNKWNYRTDDIYFVDVLFRVPDWSNPGKTPREVIRSIVSGELFRGSQRKKILNEIFDEELLSKARFLDHYHSSRHTEQQRFKLAESFLEKYATAKLVVTSRLHCALPCLAYGTPVIFVEAGFNKEQEWCRLNGITDLFNTITVEENGTIKYSFNKPDGKIDINFQPQNPSSYRSFTPGLEAACTAFVNGVSLPS